MCVRVCAYFVCQPTLSSLYLTAADKCVCVCVCTCVCACVRASVRVSLLLSLLDDAGDGPEDLVVENVHVRRDALEHGREEVAAAEARVAPPAGDEPRAAGLSVPHQALHLPGNTTVV